MRDGSDAIADWPILNALLNVAAGATWVSVHHGGGVGIGNSIHAGMVVVADGTRCAAERLERVLTTDPGTGVMRHADAGYPEAIESARVTALDLPSAEDSDAHARLLIRDLAQVATPSGAAGAAAGARARRRRRRSRTRSSSATDGTIAAVGRDARPAGARRRRRGARRTRSLGDPRPRRLPHASGVRAATASGVRAPRRGRDATRSSTRPAAASSSTVAGDPRGRRGRPARDRRAAPRLDAPARHDDVRGQVAATASTAIPSSRSCDAVAAAGACRPGWARTPFRPSSTDADAYVDFVIAEVLPDAARIAAAADVFLERGAFDIEPARRYLEPARTPGSRSGCTATSSPRWARYRSRSSSAPARSTISSRRGRPASGARRRATSRRVAARRRALPRSADAAGARARRRGRHRRPRDGLQPGQRVLREPPRSSASLAVHAARARAGGGPRGHAPSTPRTCSASPTAGRIAAGSAADIVLLDAPDWRHLAYHLAGDVVHTVIREGQVVASRA